MPLLTVLFLAVSLLGGAHPEASPDGPEATVVAYTEALKHGDFASAVSLMHPEALADFHRVVLAILAHDLDGAGAQELLGLPSREEALALEPADLFIRFLHQTMGYDEELDELLNTHQSTILSVEYEAEDEALVYLATRFQIGTYTYDGEEVHQLRLHEGQWRMLLTDDLDGILHALEAMMADDRETWGDT